MRTPEEMQERLHAMRDEIECMQYDKELLHKALSAMIYETTHLSPMHNDGSYLSKISGEALMQARAALKATEFI